MVEEAKICSPIRSTLQCWSCDVWFGVAVEKNLALSVDHCWLQALKFSVHLINLLSIPLRYNGFTRI